MLTTMKNAVARRSAIRASWCGLLVMGTLLAPRDNAWAQAVPVRQMQIDVGEDALPKEIEQRTAKGFQPVALCGYESGKAERFAVLWEKRAQPVPFQQRHGLSLDEFQDQFDALVGQGFRPVSVNVYNTGAGVRTCGLFEKKPGEWFAKATLTTDEFTKLSAEYSSKGFRLMNVTGVDIQNNPRISAMWEKLPGDKATHNAQLDPNLTLHKNAADSNDKKGLRPTAVALVPSQNRLQVVTAWTNQRGPEYVLKPTLTRKEFVESEQKYGKEYQPVNISVSVVRGEPRFSAIWEKLTR